MEKAKESAIRAGDVGAAEGLGDKAEGIRWGGERGISDEHGIAQRPTNRTGGVENYSNRQRSSAHGM